MIRSRTVERASAGPALGRMVIACLLAAAATAVAAAGGPTVERVRWSTSPERTRVVLDLDRGASFEVRRIGNPDRLAVELPGGRLGGTAPVRIADGRVRGVRLEPGADRAQVVIDLAGATDFRSFSLPARDGKPARIVIDIVAAAAPAPAVAPPVQAPLEAAVGPTDAAADDPVVGAAAGPAVTADVPRAPFTVIIDPGHGGSDPGASRGGVLEKDVVLEVARETARLVNDLPGWRAVLTRDDDSYPTLEQRVARAAAEGGDVFLSLHCNTHRRDDVAGMEVYFLSLQGASDREAQELADKENAATLVGLAAGPGVDDAVVGILMDLRMSRVLHESSRLADAVLDAAAAGGTVEARRVKQARFQVLGQLAMPAVLVELAYLSNDGDRERLADPELRRRLAADLVRGLAGWRRDDPGALQVAGLPPSSWSQEYRVRRGDNLWALAKLHGTTVQEISRRNDLASEGLAVGQVLRLPEPGRTP